jgi:hypothetical protein
MMGAVTPEEIDSILSDPVNAIIVRALNVENKSALQVADEVGLSTATIYRRRLEVSMAGRRLLNEDSTLNEIEGYRSLQVDRIEAAYARSLKTWEEAMERKEEKGYGGNSEDALNLAKLVEKYEKLLMQLVGTEKPKQIEIAGLAMTPLDAELEAVLSGG